MISFKYQPDLELDLSTLTSGIFFVAVSTNRVCRHLSRHLKNNFTRILCLYLILLFVYEVVTKNSNFSAITITLVSKTISQNKAFENEYFFNFVLCNGFTHCVPLYIIPFEEDASDFLIFWSTHLSQIGERKRNKILRWPSEIAC